MQTLGSITVDNLMTLESYHKWRKLHKPDIIKLRRVRSVQLGEHLNVQFESEATIRYQIQEMLRIEKIFEEEAIQGEIDAYAPLVPNGRNFKATILIEYADVEIRRKELARLIGIEDHIYIEVVGAGRVYAIADEDLDRETDEKTSAVHFARWELSQAMIDRLHQGAALILGCDHNNYVAQTEIQAESLASLRADLVRN